MKKNLFKWHKEITCIFVLFIDFFFISFLFPLFQMIFWSITFPNLLDFSEIIKINLNSTQINFFVINLNNFSFAFVNFGTRVLKSNFLTFFKSFNCWICNTRNSYICSNYNFFSLLDNLFNINLKSFSLDHSSRSYIWLCN